MPFTVCPQAATKKPGAELLATDVARSSSTADGVQTALRPYQQAFTNQRRRRQSHLVQLVHVQELELLARLDHERLPLFAQAEQLAVVGPGRGREGRRRRVDSRPVRQLPGPGVEAAQDARLGQRVDGPLVSHGRRQVSPGAGLRPDDELVRGLISLERDVALSTRAER